MPENEMTTISGEIDAVRPGTELSFRLAALANENEEKLKELFGSSLVIK